LTEAAGKRDIIFYVADNGMRTVLTGFLTREKFHLSLGCGKFEFDSEQDIRVAPTKDPGVHKTARELLRLFEWTHQHAVVILDADWDGSPGADAIRKHVSEQMTAGWGEYAVIVIEPELEAWILNENAHMARLFRCPDNYREILKAETEWWPEGQVKPDRPKEAIEYLRDKHRARASYADFGRLAAIMSVGQCIDPAFNELRDKLREWFPGQP
jgi:hypothetical protein